jgi:hypothetical protein
MGKKRAREATIVREFGHIEYLTQEDIDCLDKVRHDLSQSIERTRSIENVFVRGLNKVSLSNRVKHVLKVLEDINIHLDICRELSTVKISRILCWEPPLKKPKIDLDLGYSD